MKPLAPFQVMEILARAHELERRGRDVIHLEIGEPDFPTPPVVMEASQAFLRGGRVQYTAATGLPQLREAIAQHYSSRYRVDVPPSRIVVTPGASGAFLLVLGLALERDRRVLLTDPGYPCYTNLISLFGGNSELIPVNAASGYHFEPEVFSQHWNRETIGTILASPANPTGTVIDPERFEALIRFVVARHGFFLSDEIYHGLEYAGQSPTALSYSDDVFVVNSFSKYFGMTGWRVGWVIVPERCRRAAETLAQNLFISAAAPSQYAAIGALAPACRAELEQRRREFMKRRDCLVNGLISLGFQIPARPEGAFYVYVDVSRFTTDSYTFAHRLLDRQGVATTPGKDFGTHRANGFLRLAYTTSVPRLIEAIDRIRDFLSDPS
jgi:aspartate/methionine/tyrosine aminotransferase